MVLRSDRAVVSDLAAGDQASRWPRQLLPTFFGAYSAPHTRAAHRVGPYCFLRRHRSAREQPPKRM